MYIHVCVYKHIEVYAKICMCVRVYAYEFIRVSVCVCEWLHVYVRVFCQSVVERSQLNQM